MSDNLGERLWLMDTWLRQLNHRLFVLSKLNSGLKLLHLRNLSLLLLSLIDVVYLIIYLWRIFLLDFTVYFCSIFLIFRVKNAQQIWASLSTLFLAWMVPIASSSITKVL